MSLIKKISVVLILITVITSFGSSVVYSTKSTAQDTTLAFITNVLPVDISRYNVTFAKYHETEMPPYLSNGVPLETVTYTLESEDGVINVNCMIEHGVLTHCMIEPKNGSIVSDRTYANLVDAAESFLENYQTHTDDNIQEMKATLTGVESTRNMSRTSGNIKLTIQNVESSRSPTNWGLVTNKTSFRWVYTVNGVKYTELELTFRDGMFSSMSNNRGLYEIGDTDVKISKEQAIKAAMNYIKNYSYTMPGGGEVSDFEVNEDRTTAELTASPRESTLYPFWTVMLYLNQTYPGSVYALRVGIWADSGKVSFCNNQAAGGLSSDADLNYDSAQLEENQNQPTSTYVPVAITATIIVVTIALVSFKKRRK